LAVRIWNRGPAKLNQHLFRVVEKEGVYKGIIPLILDHAIEELEEKSHGTTMKHITKQTLLPHKVLLPPLPEQKRIVDLISSVDSYIEALQQQLESAKKSRNAVLHELLTSGGDNWVETTIGDISTFISIRKDPNQLSSNSIYVGLEHLEPNITSINNFDSTSKVSSSLTPFDVGDVLFGRLRPYLHKVALAEIKGFCSPEILVLRANPNVLPQMLLLY
jgi:type I restriction enzyme S subunit